jgi:SAM-dependent methyltransferase
MTEPPAFDWERFYAEDSGDPGAYVGGAAMADHLETFCEDVGPPETAYAVGCGHAATELAVADRFDDLSWVCSDRSPSAVRATRDRAGARTDVTFLVEALPELAVDATFDLVYCVATLYFVADVERALAALYERVAPGGHLVITYPNRYTKVWAESVDDPETRAAFSLVREGRNLLTYADIADVLGTTPRSYWTAVDAREADYATERSPAVYVPR